jgi:hypothetical protein
MRNDEIFINISLTQHGKRTLFITLLCVVLLIVCGFFIYRQLNRNDIALNNGTIFINGKEIRLPAQYEQIKDVFGKPNRERIFEKGTNYFWDDTGITCYSSQDRNTVKTISISLEDNQTGEDYRPAKKYPGQLSVDGTIITANSILADIKGKKGGVPLKVSMGMGSIIFPDSLVSINTGFPKTKEVKSVSVHDRKSFEDDLKAGGINFSSLEELLKDDSERWKKIK